MMNSKGFAPRPLVGFPLLPVPDERGELHFPSLEKSVRDSLEIILRTRPGEQLMRPEFGAGLENFIGASNTTATRRTIHDRIVTSIARWESRVDVERVEVQEVAGAPSQIRIEIVYRLRRTGIVQQLGLTMDLGG